MTDRFPPMPSLASENDRRAPPTDSAIADQLGPVVSDEWKTCSCGDPAVGLCCVCSVPVCEDQRTPDAELVCWKCALPPKCRYCHKRAMYRAEPLDVCFRHFHEHLPEIDAALRAREAQS